MHGMRGGGGGVTRIGPTQTWEVCLYPQIIACLNNCPTKIVNKSLLLPTIINAFIEYFPHFDYQPTIMRLSKDVIFSKNPKNTFFRKWPQIKIDPATIRVYTVLGFKDLSRSVRSVFRRMNSRKF